MRTARAVGWSVGNRLAVRDLDGWPSPVAVGPITLPGPEGGFACLFRFGAVAAVGLAPEAEQRLLQHVKAFAEAPSAELMSEELTVRVDSSAPEGLLASGALSLRELSAERAQVVATVLAKSAVLSDYEQAVATVFDRIEPLSHQLRAGRLPTRHRTLLRELGDVLAIQSRMVGRAEISEKPDIVWDSPELDHLYDALASEHELRERDDALTRKLELISTIAATYLDLMADRRVLRVEWYIVLLILVEVLLYLYDLFGRP